MRQLMIVPILLSSSTAFAGLRDQMMNNPKVMAYVQSHPSVMFSGMTFMNRHPDIDSKGPAALNDPAIRRELKELGLTEVMAIAMSEQKKQQAPAAAKPVAKTSPSTQSAKAPAAVKPAAKVASKPATAKVASTAPGTKPRLNTTYVVRKDAGLKADRQRGLTLASTGVHLTGKTRRVMEENGRPSHWLQVADAKGTTGWVNIGAKHNLGGSTGGATAIANARPAAGKVVAQGPAPAAPLQAPAPQAPPETPAAGKAEGPKVTDLPPKTPDQPNAQAGATPTPAAPAAVTPTTTSSKVEDAKECASNAKDFESKGKLKKAFKDSNPFTKTWAGPLPGVKLAPGKNDGLEIELNPEIQQMAGGMLEGATPEVKKRMEGMLATMKTSNNRAPFDFMVCIDGDGQEPYRADLGNKSYFSKDRKTIPIATPGMPEAPFTLEEGIGATAAAK